MWHTQVVEGVWKTKSGEDLRVREVWQENLDEEMEIIRTIVDDYPFLAMDTEFPGVVARPVGPFKNSGEYHYQTLRCAALHLYTELEPSSCSILLTEVWFFYCRCNVDMLKLIQLGLTFSDAKGELASLERGTLCLAVQLQVWFYPHHCFLQCKDMCSCLQTTVG